MSRSSYLRIGWVQRVACKAFLKHPCFLRRTFEINDDPLQDLSTPTGFALALSYVMRLKEGGLLWGGLPCGSSPAFEYRFQQPAALWFHKRIYGYSMHIRKFSGPAGLSGFQRLHRSAT